MINFDLEEIKELIRAMQENSITELCLESEGIKLNLKRESDRKGVVDIGGFSLPTSEEIKKNSLEGISQSKSEGVFIKSPMVGTFYRSPSPNSPPFVEVGDYVKKGQVVCIIEAMKLMNEIESEVEGTIKEILVENAMPVEFGQPLMVVEPQNIT
ncbi:acetyl-CoA carboxylase, biotin carboxyl carrier protein [Thermodesulfobium narugense DSM 14796]|uniref:Biotin carboxyl carrier protein of acetyl-CoA carboxylase n=1 Tax=Thermodesulfobium narugense DSM 14796 TaxID=747365 RepID=M1E5L2_9BACT|nr:acetyl-CoA carboxylase biotin carboxyl carrier protein [Thermodesulfobium narugense]AEE13768.1 acetyl-CoA carboxylase, biotin carboxyl carrier protein [Thermodesulfobium narugense DSM 14796]